MQLSRAILQSPPTGDSAKKQPQKCEQHHPLFEPRQGRVGLEMFLIPSSILCACLANAVAEFSGYSL